jgi:hypothetical protein
MFGGPRAHEISRPETLHFAGHVTGIRTRIKCSDEIDSGLARDESVPKGVLADAIGGYHAEAGNYYATGPSQRSLPESSAP